MVDVDRGGKITWHGRGQLVGYPILHLRDRSLVKDYVCTLEAVIMKVLAEDYGIRSERVEGRSGVWLTDGPRDRKIAAVGIRVHRSVTMHGFSLNCSNPLEPSRTSSPAESATPTPPPSVPSWGALCARPTSRTASRRNCRRPCPVTSVQVSGRRRPRMRSRCSAPAPSHSRRKVSSSDRTGSPSRRSMRNRRNPQHQCRPRGPADAARGGQERRSPRGAQARVDALQGQDGPRVRRDEEAGRLQGSAHRLRRGRLSQHL